MNDWWFKGYRSSIGHVSVISAVFYSLKIFGVNLIIMRKLVRQNVDVCSGHGCWPPRVAVSGSPNVKCENKPVIRVGDSWAPHTCITTHGGTQATGSPNVFVNGQALARVGDSISCGSINAQGSHTVFVN